MIVHYNKALKILKPYFILVILFVFAGFLINTVETFLFFKYQDSISFSAVALSYFNIITAFCFYSFIIFPVYLLIGWLKQKPAQIFASILFALLTSLEIGLFIYYKQTGVLMGTEIVVRPVSETLATIRNSSNIIINIIAIIGVVGLFVTLPFVLKKVKFFNHFLSLTIGLIAIGVFSAGVVFYQKNENTTLNNYLESKSFHFFLALKSHLMHEPETDFLIYENERNVEKIKKNENLLIEHTKLYPHRTISDLNYPLERLSSEIPDVLSPFFEKSENPPNIVIIIVESLGSFLMGEKGENISFTPFLDSLAKVGLYWKNCLATTPRTFGAVPAVLGSVPHGMRGFQFGIMPNHHSLFSILKDNNYSTHFFYGCDPNFDNVIDFLTIQGTDHVDNFLPQMKEFRKQNLATWWGLYDHVLFNESFKHLKTVPIQKPKVNLYLTITTHDPLSDNDKDLKIKYENKTEKLFSKLDSKQKSYFSPIKKLLASFVYVDDAIRDLIHNYSKQSDFENTIFIITGDHSVSPFKNRLAHFSVPLIIWSPLLTKPQTFSNIVSHSAITPSVLSLLHHNYHVELPNHVAWYSDGLDTASVFNPKEKVLLLNYERSINEMVYNQYFFDNSDYKLYEMDENLDFNPIQDVKLIENMSAKFNTLKYINHYVYHNNKMIKHTGSSSKYKIIKKYENLSPIVCKTPDTIPSISGIKTYYIMPAQNISGKHDKIKIQFSADLVINDYIYQDAQMMLNFVCLGENFKYVSSELITKYIADENVLSDIKYELLIEKEVDVSATDNISVSITVSSNEWDENWEPDRKITISNIRVLFGVNEK